MTDTTRNKWFSFAPNLLTTFNLLSGVIGLYFAFKHQLNIAFTLMVIGALFDFSDGFVARLLKVSGELGKQLDSLADMVTFGVLPGVIVFSIQYQMIIGEAGNFNNLSFLQWVLLLSPLLIPALSALRLAKFNIDTRQSQSFIGLPTPANALFFASLAYTILYTNNPVSTFAANPIVIAVLTLLFSYLLVAEIPLFSLKFKSLKFKENIVRFSFLFFSALVIALLKIPGIAIVILLYIATSLVENMIVRQKMR
ncbi:MAG TPA: CDP-diacylglycerol--serine O-phosphatidyltransferase [Prolixibacteraceae bacterium]|nr:CDP-diacylglycerol--serine O-phosphatidyltransferase [Prolixibacteraceae bacterium]